ncbi:MAG TPA: hypothetical protein VMK83_02095 [Gaiellaceae bacterium]|nr:hypothetical protein [Gaiellaceae bacterium]
MRALFVLPFATFDAPRWLHEALETRALATIAGRCACGATYDRAGLRPGEVHTPPMLHENDCPATDPRLESAAVLPEWIELHAIGVELPDEAAA